jgi:hypothetical protein
MKILHAVRLRVPDLRSTDQGESGPKDKPRGEADGKPVKILAPVLTAKWGRRHVGIAHGRKCALKFGKLNDSTLRASA